MWFVPKMVCAQATTDLYLQLEYNHQSIAYPGTYTSKQGDSLQISQVKWYLSHPQIGYADGSKQAFAKTYHLYDWTKPASHLLPLPETQNKPIAYLEFSVGIDSIPNTQGALADELDVQNGMYWAWQSGYINVKIEGTCTQCPTHQHEFGYHLGGYKKGQNALRTIRLPYTGKRNPILHLDLGPFFDAISVRTKPNVQIPGQAAMQLTDLLISNFWLDEN